MALLRDWDWCSSNSSTKIISPLIGIFPLELRSWSRICKSCNFCSYRLKETVTLVNENVSDKDKVVTLNFSYAKITNQRKVKGFLGCICLHLEKQSEERFIKLSTRHICFSFLNRHRLQKGILRSPPRGMGSKRTLRELYREICILRACDSISQWEWKCNCWQCKPGISAN